MFKKTLSKFETKRYYICLPWKFIRENKFSLEETVKVRVKGKVFTMKIDRLGRIFFTILSRDYLK